MLDRVVRGWYLILLRAQLKRRFSIQNMQSGWCTLKMVHLGAYYDTIQHLISRSVLKNKKKRKGTLIVRYILDG